MRPMDAIDKHQELLLAAEAIRVSRPDWHVEAFALIDSTNAEARRRIKDGSARGATLLLADHQDAGRGRDGRTWVDTPACAFLGTLAWKLRGTSPPTLWPLQFAVALADSIELLANCEIEVKWPNDLLLNGGKLAGILMETAGADWMIGGVGVNIEQTRAELPRRAPHEPPATSLAHELGTSAPRRDEAIVQIATGLMMRVDAPLPREVLVGAWLKRWHGEGKPCAIRTPHGVVEGIMRGIGETGALLIETPGCEVIPVHSPSMIASAGPDQPSAN